MNSRERRRKKEQSLKRQIKTIRRSPVIHFIELACEIKSHDNHSIYGAQGSAGPLVARKAVNFSAIGTSVEDAVKEVHDKLLAFLSSNAITVGVEEKSNLLSPFSGKTPLTEQ